jgi:hypothetical protein
MNKNRDKKFLIAIIFLLIIEGLLTWFSMDYELYFYGITIYIIQIVLLCPLILLNTWFWLVKIHEKKQHFVKKVIKAIMVIITMLYFSGFVIFAFFECSDIKFYTVQFSGDSYEKEIIVKEDHVIGFGRHRESYYVKISPILLRFIKTYGLERDYGSISSGAYTAQYIAESGTLEVQLKGKNGEYDYDYIDLP